MDADGKIQAGVNLKMVSQWDLLILREESVEALEQNVTSMMATNHYVQIRQLLTFPVAGLKKRIHIVSQTGEGIAGNILLRKVVVMLPMVAGGIQMETGVEILLINVGA